MMQEHHKLIAIAFPLSMLLDLLMPVAMTFVMNHEFLLLEVQLLEHLECLAAEECCVVEVHTLMIVVQMVQVQFLSSCNWVDKVFHRNMKDIDSVLVD